MNQDAKQTVLISGASGFLGQEIISQLINKNTFKIIALTSRKEKVLDKVGKSPNLLVLDSSKWFNQVEKNIEIDTLINCAFPTTSNPNQLVEGINYTENLIKKSIQLKIPRIINISSQSVYSQKAKESKSEKALVIPESLYGMSKYTTERIVALTCESADQHTIYSNIRLASLTGTSLEKRLLNRFVRKALNRDTIEINGGNKLISYLHVKDAASAIISMISVDSKLWKPLYNLGNHHFYTLAEVAEFVDKISYEYSVNGVEIKIEQSDDNFNNLLNSELFYSDFKWKPEYDVPLMVDELFSYYKNKM